MGTQSIITYASIDGTYIATTCNFDGYPSGVGKHLYNHYTDAHKVMKLVSGGAMSELHESCDRPKGHSFDNPIKGHTIYYHRDRDRPWDECAPKVYYDLHKIDVFGGCWAYIFMHGRWHVKSRNDMPFLPLKDYINPFSKEFEHTPLCHRVNVYHVPIILDIDNHPFITDNQSSKTNKE